MSEPTIPLPEESEAVDPGLTLDWYFNRRLVIYRVTSAAPDVLAVWAETALRLINDTPDERPFLAIHDLTHRGVSLSYAVKVKYDLLNAAVTPEGRTRLEALLDQRPGLIGRVALVFSPTFSGNIGQTFARYGRARQMAVQYRAFFDLYAAFEWLKEAV